MSFFDNLFKSPNPKDKLNELRQRISPKSESVSKKEFADPNPCPTEVLMYISTGIYCPHKMDPWYDQIKKLAHDAPYHFSYFHKAVIDGMYPELDKAFTTFKEEVKKHADDSGKTSLADTKRIEKQIIQDFKLKESYSFISPQSEEQKQRINNNLIKAADMYVDEESKRFSPIVQILTKAQKKNIDKSVSESLDLIDFFETLDNILDLGEHNMMEKRQKFPTMEEQFCIAESIFKMQKEGIIDDNFRVKKWEEFKNSDLIEKGISYNGKQCGLKNNLITEAAAVSLSKHNIWEK